MNSVWPIFKREFAAYFATPLAYVFIVIFLFAMGAFTFYIGHFYENGVADLSVFFGFHPWLYLFLVPAISMRLWAEERRTGTMELLLTLPVPLWATVTGKFLAAWAFTAVALALTFPIWITVNFLGNPDNGVIFASYIGSLLMAGGYLAIGACVSASTSNQVIAFVVSVVVCFLFTISGAPLVLDVFRSWAPLALVNAISSFSFLTHFTAISAGVIDLRDVIFFFTLIALFLTANVVIIDLKKRVERAMKALSRRTYAIAAIVLAAIIFVGVNIAADATFTTERLDLTQTGAFTLAKGTKNIISKVEEPITLKFFYSKKIAADYAQINAYAGRVHDLLEEYVARSHGKIILEDVDAEPFTPAEDEASADGLSGAPTESGDTVYFGLVGSNTIAGREIIPFFSQDREPYLEYDITSLIYRLSTPKKPALGIITSLPLDTGAGGMMAAMQGNAQPFMIYQELNQTYTTKMLDAGFTSIPRDIDVLMIAQPGNLTPQQNYAIDQFVLGGGHSLVFVDPNSELMAASQPPGGEPAGPSASDLPTLFRAWGIAYNPGKVLGDRLRAQAVQMQSEGGPAVVRYPVWLQLTTGDFDSKDQVTANLQTLNLASVGALSQAKGATTTFEPLVSSSNEASLLDSMDVKLNPRPQDLMQQIEPTGQRFTIAARISGPVKTAFPKGLPGATGPRLTVSKGPINVIVMADSDIFDDKFWVHVENLYGKKMAAPFADNAAFVLNAVENLTGSDDLISLRTRAANNRPFVVVQKMQAEAQAEFQQQADALKQQLTDTEARLHALEQGGSTNGQPTNSLTLTPDQQAEIERFKRQLVQTRTDLRDVQSNLRGSIDLLGTILAFVNIWLVPILVSVFAIVLAVLRRRRRARAVVSFEGAPMFETIRNDPRRRNLAILAVVAVVTSLLALITLVEQARETAPHYREETFFSGLAAHAGNVAHIKIVSKNGDIDLALKGAGWVIANHDDYPASFDQVHQTVVGMAALLTLQPATSRADWLHYVGLDTPPHGDGVLIALRDERGNDLASLILGKTQDIGDPSGAIGLFVRKPGDMQTWLARSPYEFKSDLGDWFDKTVMNVDRARIQETDVDPASGPSFTVRRDTPGLSDFKLTDVPKGREVADGATDGIAAAITGFTFDDVKPAKNFDFSDAGHPTRVTTKTFDGLTVTVEAIQQGGNVWATVSAEGAPGKSDAKKEARDIDSHTFGWAYELAAYKGQQFMTTEDSLLKPVGGAAPAQPAPQQIPPVQ